LSFNLNRSSCKKIVVFTNILLYINNYRRKAVFGGTDMELNETIKTVCDEIVKNFGPEKVILYNVKRSVGGEIRGFKICVIVETENRLDTEKHIYLDVDSDIPFDVLVYTPAEWDELQNEKTSFACRIIKEGTYIHG
jgi:hypothetical protein